MSAFTIPRKPNTNIPDTTSYSDSTRRRLVPSRPGGLRSMTCCSHYPSRPAGLRSMTCCSHYPSRPAPHRAAQHDLLFTLPLARSFVHCPYLCSPQHIDAVALVTLNILFWLPLSPLCPAGCVHFLIALNLMPLRGVHSMTCFSQCPQKRSLSLSERYIYIYTYILYVCPCSGLLA